MMDLLQHLIPDFAHMFSANPNGISAWFWLVTALIFGFSLFFLMLHFRHFRARMRALRSLLDGQSKETLAANRRETLHKAQELKATNVGMLWREFDESLVLSSDQQKLFNTLDAEHFFNARTLASGLTASRLLAAAPSFLVAVGVLGTFVGLTVGLEALRRRGIKVEVSENHTVLSIPNDLLGFDTGAYETPARRSADVESVAANGAMRSSTIASWRDNPVPQRTKLPPFSSLQMAALRYLETHPRCGFYALLEAVSNQGGNVLNVKTMLESSLSQYVQQDGEGHWLLSTHGEQLVAELARSEPSDASQSVPSAANMNANENAGSRVARLEPFALAVLRYFAANPGDKVRYAANVLEVDARLVNQALYGPLKGICTQDDKYGWQLTGAAQRELEAFEAEGREQ